MFDPPDDVAFNRIPYSEDDSPAHREIALCAARESIVLLKNQDGILPLGNKIRTLAVVGPNVESLHALEGNYNGTPSNPIYPIDGIRKILGDKTKIIYAQGAPYVELLPVPVPSSVYHLPDDRAQPGLKAEYFDGTDFSGKPVVTRIDPRIQFDWNAAVPVPGLHAKEYSHSLDRYYHAARAGQLHVQRPQTRLSSRRR